MSLLVYALALALVWMLIVGSLSVDVFVIGFVGGLALMVFFRPAPPPVRWRMLPGQLVAMLLYVIALFRDIVLSGIDVARRVLSPDMALKPGIIAVSTQDEERSPLIVALSAAYIGLTPGELIVETEDDHLMYIHCLDAPRAAAAEGDAQARRLVLLRRILGKRS
ncbi:MAG: Na+/H+ antiporter subunit E [Anaerolineae bacterium]|nr:Na+/H+ antiporter subunit E [Anaerolineae bacterium]